MMFRNTLKMVCVLVASLGIAPLSLANDHWSDDWDIEVDGKSDNGGVVSFRIVFEPAEDGTSRDPITVDAPIGPKTGENDAADLIGNAFEAQLSDEEFKVSVSGGEHVKIKARGDTPDFVVELAGSEVKRRTASCGLKVPVSRTKYR